MKDSTSIKEANKADGNNICDTHIWQQECDNLKDSFVFTLRLR
jgi:hypothetical protein